MDSSCLITSHFYRKNQEKSIEAANQSNRMEGNYATEYGAEITLTSLLRTYWHPIKIRFGRGMLNPVY
jgi:hypothetical protein